MSSFLKALVWTFCFQEDDSLGKKVGGAVVNAAIFVSLIAALTLVLVLLFKKGVSVFKIILATIVKFFSDTNVSTISFQYTKFIYGYMAFSGFSIFFMLTGTIAMQLVQKIGVHWDFPSFLYILFNYAVSVLSLHIFIFTIIMRLVYPKFCSSDVDDTRSKTISTT